MRRGHFLLSTGLLMLILGVVFLTGSTQASAQNPPATPAATQAATKPAATPPAKEDALGKAPTFLLDIYNAWLGSGHAKFDSEAFRHWDKEGAVPGSCAQCHSTSGYRDYVGADASTAGKVDAKDYPTGTVVNCDGCHSKEAQNLKTVKFSSGLEVGNMGDSTRCLVCHQGRASVVQVNAAIDKAKAKDTPDTPTKDLTFVNVHYYAAAATLYGSEVKGGYEYDGKSYQMRFNHVPGYNTCAGCHDSHTLKVKVSECATCHKDVKTEDDLAKIRMNGRLSDFDGDGSIKEGIKEEIDGVRTVLMQTMQAYATKVTKVAIAYDAASYPYFFVDKNANGKVDDDEKVATNGYNAFSARLLEAAYNYQVSVKDPGAFAHNASYTLELLYDSIESLNTQLGDGTGTTKLVRTSPGHFDSTSEAFRHWDKDKEVPGSCAKCHTSTGLPTFLKNSTNIAVAPSNSFACSTCHNDLSKFTMFTTDSVTFPSGAKVTFGKEKPANLCITCHQGRESTVSVNTAITNSKAKDDEVSDKLAFRNVHYFAAGATFFGTEAKGAYEYTGKDYNGRSQHPKPQDSCVGCHDVHTLEVKVDKCTKCHEDFKDVKEIRASADDVKPVDYNGNGDSKEPIAKEVQAFQDELLKQIQVYAKAKGGTAIAYNAASYPYFFTDTNGNGKVDADEAKADNAYKTWTPNLLRAAYNYQYAQKDPGQFAHNPHYILQVLYDSIESMGGKDAVAKFTRPAVDTE